MPAPSCPLDAHKRLHLDTFKSYFGADFNAEETCLNENYGSNVGLFEKRFKNMKHFEKNSLKSSMKSADGERYKCCMFAELVEL